MVDPVQVFVKLTSPKNALSSSRKHKLVGGFNPFKKYYNSQNGNLPQIGVKITNIWNHHPEKHALGSFCSSRHPYGISTVWFGWKFCVHSEKKKFIGLHQGIHADNTGWYWTIYIYFLNTVYIYILHTPHRPGPQDPCMVYLATFGWFVWQMRVSITFMDPMDTYIRYPPSIPVRITYTNINHL